MFRFMSRFADRRSVSGLRFIQDEGGSMVIFGLMVLVLMLGSGGMAIDIMRYEANRTKLQYTLDRAVLAAASLNQGLAPKTVVIDYLAKAGITGYHLDVDLEQGLNYRKVTATSYIDVNSIFLTMVGVDKIRAPASAVAEERVQNIEISLVLDISGSMGDWSNSGGDKKINLMQTAAEDFVDTVLTPAQTGLITMSVIPYNGQVNAGSLVSQYFPLSTEHTASNCVRFSDYEYSVTGITSGTVLSRIGHFDRDSGNSSNMRWPHCDTSEYGAILPWSNNVTALKARINSLKADGWTATNEGMKWASLLLDPTTRGIHSQMINDGIIPIAFTNRPANYSDPETMKVVVLMTDGDNTNSYDLKSEFRSGMSNVWMYTDKRGNVDYSYYIPETGKFRESGSNSNRSSPVGGNSAERLSYPDLWAMHPVRYVADTIYAPSRNGSSPYDWQGRIRGAVEQYGWGSVSDTRMNSICTATKNQGVLIFTIGFEAPSNGRTVMRNCASSHSHFYDVNGIEIQEAFTAIARTINQLKLTQ